MGRFQRMPGLRETQGNDVNFEESWNFPLPAARYSRRCEGNNIWRKSPNNPPCLADVREMLFLSLGSMEIPLSSPTCDSL